MLKTNIKTGYVIEVFDNNMYAPDMILDADGIPVYPIDRIYMYDTEAEAEESLNIWLNKAKDFAAKYIGSEERIEIEKFMEEVPDGIVEIVFTCILKYNEKYNKLLVNESDDLSVLEGIDWRIEQKVIECEDIE